MEYLNISPTSEPSSPLPPSETHEPGPTNSSGSGSETSESNPAPVTINMDASGDATISAAFQPSLRIDDLLPDLTLISSNNVYFYVHRHRITGASSNSFGGLLLFDWGAHRHGFLPSLHLPETGDVINVVLHTMYGLSCLHFHPSLETVEAALDALIKYGVPIETYTAPFQPLYQLILSHAPYRPIETYALAGRHQLEDLAVTVSGHLLSFDLSRITDDLAKKMGPVYLKRLFLLHQSRLMALKELLLKPPANHPVTPGCNPNEHGKLTRAWALTTAQLVWDAMPSKPITGFEVDVPEAQGLPSVALSVVGISPNSLRALLEPIAETIVCESCRKMLQQRIQEVMYSWGQVKPTI
ncbi:hypothetical protein BN946_scf184743.g6 [Trametes cinnabarina]|uniref:BTB domain-containing protein n=1 Tax=Pycnoporus cinnabarinus TaxID=5643 RepID=A0A060SN82_PYCCI|nr:hypothetical protein BN946_scf184743.g6 [Trametes cinnabarina]